jgi:hypothetical protein
MCLIIDANKAADFCKQERPYLKPLWSWVNGGGRIVSGGRLEKELFKIQAMKGVLLEWSRNGTLIRISSEKILEKENFVKSACISDDPHVVALAIISKANIVVTEDKKLIEDLRNCKLVGKRRRIYKENSASPSRIDRHATLLRSSDCP